MKKQGIQKYVKYGQGGFTLIELLIVVAIIGILAAIAIPRYQDYIARSQVGSALQEISPLRTAVEEFALRIPVDQLGTAINVYTIGAPNAADGDTSTTTNFGTITVTGFDAGTGAGDIVHTLNEDVTASIDGAILTLSRSALGDWTCVTTPSGADGWKDSYASTACPVAGTSP